MKTATTGLAVSGLGYFGELGLNAQSQPPTLRSVASQKGRLYGSAALQHNLAADPAYAKLFSEQCGILVPEGELKWGSLRPSPTSYDFSQADWLLAFAKQSQMKMRGHTLVWYQSLPKWFAGYVNAGNARQVLVDHIEKVVGHFAGQMHSWDVVNEVLYPDDHIDGGWRNTPWNTFLGPTHIELAFRTAAAADPKAMLVWNENHVEDESYSHERKRAVWLQQLRALLAKGVPIGGIGIQSHLIGGKQQLGGPKFKQFLSDVNGLGLKILVTEMDVQDDQFPMEIKSRDKQVADVYLTYLTAVLQCPATVAVLTWGLTSKYSWLKTYMRRKDGNDPRPLPFDANLNRTATFDAIERAFVSS